MATVFLARQAGLGRVVALKELDRLDAGDQRVFAARFLREAHLAASLNHPGIVSVIDYFEHGGRAYIAMEYVEGGSLRGYLDGLSLAQVAGVLEGLLGGLAHAEGRGIVHRDIKPENILVTGEGRVKIADFGIAKLYNAALTQSVYTVAGATVGTPRYMAPEQGSGKPLSAATDLYAVGVVAYEMLVGRAPFDSDESPLAIVYQHVNDPVPDPRELCPGLDARLCGWLERLLAKDPAARPASATEVLEGLEEIVLDLLGGRWRREAPLAAPEATEPLTPAGLASVAGRPQRDAPAAPVTEGSPRGASSGATETPLVSEEAPEPGSVPDPGNAPCAHDDRTVAYRRDRPTAPPQPSATARTPGRARVAAWALTAAIALIAAVTGLGLWVASERRNDTAAKRDLRALRLATATVKAGMTTGALIQRMAASTDAAELGALVPDLDESVSEAGRLRQATLRTLPEGDAARRDLVGAQRLEARAGVALRDVAEAPGTPGNVEAVASARTAYKGIFDRLEATTRLIRRRLSSTGDLDPADDRQLGTTADELAGGKSRTDANFDLISRLVMRLGGG